MCDVVARERKLTGFTATDAERQQVFVFLTSPECGFFQSAPEEVNTSAHDLDRLVEISNGDVGKTLRYLKAMNTRKEQFNTYAELLVAFSNEVCQIPSSPVRYLPSLYY